MATTAKNTTLVDSQASVGVETKSPPIAGTTGGEEICVITDANNIAELEAFIRTFFRYGDKRYNTAAGGRRHELTPYRFQDIAKITNDARITDIKIESITKSRSTPDEGALQKALLKVFGAPTPSKLSNEARKAWGTSSSTVRVWKLLSPDAPALPPEDTKTNSLTPNTEVTDNAVTQVSETGDDKTRLNERGGKTVEQRNTRAADEPCDGGSGTEGSNSGQLSDVRPSASQGEAASEALETNPDSRAEKSRASLTDDLNEASDSSKGTSISASPDFGEDHRKAKQFFELLGKTGLWVWHNNPPNAAPNINKKFDSIEGAFTYCNGLNGKADLYFAVGEFSGTSRTRAASLGINAFMLDVDSHQNGKGFATPEEALNAANAANAAIGLPEPTTIRSGGGVHFYWLLDKLATPVDWDRVAKKLKKALVAYGDKGITDDLARVTDIAGIMRLPSFLNVKRNALATVDSIGTISTLDDIERRLNYFLESKVQAHTEGGTKQGLGASLIKFPTGEAVDYATYVSNATAFLNEVGIKPVVLAPPPVPQVVQSNRVPSGIRKMTLDLAKGAAGKTVADLSEWEWKEWASALLAFDDGYELAKEFSQSDERYKEGDIELLQERIARGELVRDKGRIANLWHLVTKLPVIPDCEQTDSDDTKGVSVKDYATNVNAVDSLIDSMRSNGQSKYDLYRNLPNTLREKDSRAAKIKAIHDKLSSGSSDVKRPLVTDGDVNMKNVVFAAARQVAIEALTKSGAMVGDKVRRAEVIPFTVTLAKVFRLKTDDPLVEQVGEGIKAAVRKSNDGLALQSSTGTYVGDAGGFEIRFKPPSGAAVSGRLKEQDHDLGQLDFSCPDGKPWQRHYADTCAFLSQYFAKVMYGRKAAVVGLVESEIAETWYHEFYEVEELAKNYSHIEIQVGETKDGAPKYKTLFEAFAKWKHVPTFRRMTCDSRGSKAGVFNTWRGFSVEPKQDDDFIAPFKRHLLEIICDGDKKMYDYLVGWMADSFQYPEKQAGVAFVMQGKKGAGKGVLGNLLHQLWGVHGFHITKPKHLTGDFNGHLHDKRFLFVDEAFFAGDKSQDGTIKGMITEDTITIERKGMDAIEAANYSHIMIASNEARVVSATSDERRYAVVNVNPNRLRDFTYFKALTSITRSERGMAAILHWLLNYDLAEFNIRDVPETKALADQRAENLDYAGQWMRDCLENGGLFQNQAIGGVYLRWEETVSFKALYNSYREWSDAKGGKRREYPKSKKAIGSFLAEVFPRVAIGHAKDVGYALGSLKEAIKLFEEKIKIELAYD